MPNYTVTWQLSTDAKRYELGGGFPLTLEGMGSEHANDDGIRAYVIDATIREIDSTWHLHPGHVVRLVLREWGVKEPLFIEHVDGLGQPITVYPAP